MENNNFDKLIKDKLEAFEPEFDHNDWLQYQSHAKNASILKTWTLVKNGIAATVGVCMLTGAFWIFKMNQKQYILTQQVQQFETKNQHLANELTETQKAILTQKQLLGNYEKTIATLTQNEQNITKENQILANKYSQLTKIIQLQNTSQQQLQAQLNENTLLLKSKTETQNITQNNSINSVVLENIDSKNLHFEELIFAQTKIKPIDKQPEYYSKKMFSLQNMGLRVGLNGGLAKSSQFTGIRIDWFLDSRNFISIGYQNRFIADKFFEDKMAYKNANRYDFGERFSIEPRPFDKIKDITVFEKISEIPIRYNYLHPLKNDFYLGASAGGNFTLNVLKKINFDLTDDRRLPNGEPLYSERAIISSKSKPNVFSNVAFGILAEKRWNKFAISAGLEQKIPTKKVDYDLQKSYTQFKVGARFMVF